MGQVLFAGAYSSLRRKVKAINLSERLKGLKPKHFLVLFLVFILFFGIALGIYNYRQDQIRPSEIRITSPAQGGERVEAEKITVAGETRGNRKVVVGGIETRSDRDGRFRVEAPLLVGSNEIKIEVSEGLEYSSATVVVVREERAVAPAPITDIPVVDAPKPQAPVLSQTGSEYIFFAQVALILGSFLVYMIMRKRFRNPQKS